MGSIGRYCGLFVGYHQRGTVSPQTPSPGTRSRLYSAVGYLHRTALARTAPYCILSHAPRCTHMHRAELTCTTLHHIALICAVLHRTALTCTVLHHTALTCTVLHSHAPHCTHMHRTAEHCFHAHLIASYCPDMHSLASYCTNIYRDNALSAARPDNRDAWSNHTAQNQQSNTLACGTTARNAALVLVLFDAFWRVQHTRFWRWKFYVLCSYSTP